MYATIDEFNNAILDILNKYLNDDVHTRRPEDCWAILADIFKKMLTAPDLCFKKVLEFSLLEVSRKSAQFKSKSDICKLILQRFEAILHKIQPQLQADARMRSESYMQGVKFIHANINKAKLNIECISTEQLLIIHSTLVTLSGLLSTDEKNQIEDDLKFYLSCIRNIEQYSHEKILTVMFNSQMFNKIHAEYFSIYLNNPQVYSALLTLIRREYENLALIYGKINTFHLLKSNSATHALAVVYLKQGVVLLCERLESWLKWWVAQVMAQVPEMIKGPLVWMASAFSHYIPDSIKPSFKFGSTLKAALESQIALWGVLCSHPNTLHLDANQLVIISGQKELWDTLFMEIEHDEDKADIIHSLESIHGQQEETRKRNIADQLLQKMRHSAISTTESMHLLSLNG